ncbi:MAG: hypothetical protein COB46_04450 [Rhodospirillaceae bacterium]|nr:MAG: hypothetical protein COB46_04450 [Rhodospirillaceae bacterium]
MTHSRPPNEPGVSVADQVSKLLFWSMAYKASDAIDAFVDTGIAQQLALAPMSAQALAQENDLQEDYLLVLLKFAVQLGLLRQDGAKFDLTEAAKTVLPLIKLEAHTRAWHMQNESLTKVLSGAGPQDPMADVSSETRTLYDTALSGFARGLALSIRRIRDIPAGAKILDVGGADGSLALQLQKVGAARSVIVADRATVRPHFEQAMEMADSSKDIDFVGVDLTNPESLRDQVKSVDVIVVSNVVHLLPKPLRVRFWSMLREHAQPGTFCLVYDQFPGGGRGSGITASDLMVVDWIKCGVVFDFTAEQQGEEMRESGLTIRHIVSSPILPGEIVVSCVE